MPTALITGASAGLGKALATELANRGWRLIIDGRDRRRLGAVSTDLQELTEVRAVAGDIGVPAHRIELAAAVELFGSLDLLVNNASTLGPTPLRPLAGLTATEFSEILETNVVAPLALTNLVLPFLARSSGSTINVTSDAAAEHYERWGGYGAGKAALDHLTGTYGAEHPELRFYSVDPGDLRTAMHQAAFPGEDISDRPLPETAVGPILSLLDRRPASGRYRAADYATGADIGTDPTEAVLTTGAAR
jgi:NAD(P)-dependent dehydrogenase (short-subunit alcohol dehydrogenase family)